MVTIMTIYLMIAIHLGYYSSSSSSSSGQQSGSGTIGEQQQQQQYSNSNQDDSNGADQLSSLGEGQFSGIVTFLNGLKLPISGQISLQDSDSSQQENTNDIGLATILSSLISYLNNQISSLQNNNNNQSSSSYLPNSNVNNSTGEQQQSQPSNGNHKQLINKQLCA